MMFNRVSKKSWRIKPVKNIKRRKLNLKQGISQSLSMETLIEGKLEAMRSTADVTASDLQNIQNLTNGSQRSTVK